MSLGATLAEETNPLVVIAWGHGGKQGNLPVFHVRGPRLAPSDFKGLASQADGRESRWILMFRAAARLRGKLAGEQRQILSSESDTMFASDPIGMAVLLKLARAKPEWRSFSLSEEFGRATAAWYKERNLARTEEPTLWLDKGEAASAGACDGGEFAGIGETGRGRGGTNQQTCRSVAGFKRVAGGVEGDQTGRPPSISDADGVVFARG